MFTNPMFYNSYGQQLEPAPDGPSAAIWCIWTKLDASGATWSYGPSGAMWTRLGPSGTNWGHLEPSAIWKILEPSGAM